MANGTDGTEEMPPVCAGVDFKELFTSRVAHIMAPKEYAPILADIFFKGDIDEMDWLREVLIKFGSGYVTDKEARLIMAWWAVIRQLDWDILNEIKAAPITYQSLAPLNGKYFTRKEAAQLLSDSQGTALCGGFQLFDECRRLCCFYRVGRNKSGASVYEVANGINLDRR